MCLSESWAKLRHKQFCCFVFFFFFFFVETHAALKLNTNIHAQLLKAWTVITCLNLTVSHHWRLAACHCLCVCVCVYRQRQPGCTSSVGVSATVNTLHTHHHIRCILNLTTGGWRRRRICYRLSLIHYKLTFLQFRWSISSHPPNLQFFCSVHRCGIPFPRTKGPPGWVCWHEPGKSISEIWMPFVASRREAFLDLFCFF